MTAASADQEPLSVPATRQCLIIMAPRANGFSTSQTHHNTGYTQAEARQPR